jgi:hypothetical protein
MIQSVVICVHPIIPAARRIDSPVEMADGCYLFYFARSRHTNPARIPVSPLGCRYYIILDALKIFLARPDRWSPKVDLPMT